jgi:antibiotic biosynthesis monooxygenase (ABM) superfamily enzyme
MYVMSQQVSWWGAAAWAVFIFAVLKKKTWAIPVGIFAAAMSMMAGYPLGINNALFEVHRFSMFLPAPLLSTGLLVYLLLPSTRRMLSKWNTALDKPEEPAGHFQPGHQTGF